MCIHGHFYQPPRENPWLEMVDLEESAYPYHDWNTRITAECYAPNSASRIMDPQWRIIGLVNNYSRISFNFGPTLLYWISRHNPDVYQAILDADKESANSYSGHGSAIAQVYNHMIMPLANKRDKETQVDWGIRDFQIRFKRYPEGMWLPETAVDTETLEVLAEHNIKFTILAPHQAARIRKIGDKEWTDASNGKIDPRRAYLCKLPSGKSISIFFFDRIVTTDTAFGNLLDNGELLAKRLDDAFKDSAGAAALVNIASDGELYGHHHPHGDMTLAYCLYYIASNNLAKITNYAEFLEKNQPEFEVEIQQNTSWSCVHGIERWRSDCGCNTGRAGWKQAWRKPLREAMDWLRDTLSSNFEIEARKYLKDPWKARDSYIELINDRSKENVDKFLNEQAQRTLNEDEKRQTMKLLEMQRQAMLMYTSCGWFFDEISGIETVQVMTYAARAIQLVREICGLELEDKYINLIAQAPSNIAQFENGAKTYDILVRPAIVNLAKIGAQHTILSLFSDEKTSPTSALQVHSCCFKVADEELEKHEAGKFRLAVSHSKIHSEITLDEEVIGCAAIWLGDHNILCGVKQGMDEETFKSMRNEIIEGFEKGQINETILLIPKHFGESKYSLKDIFKDDQRRILEFILSGATKKAIDLYDIIYKDNSAMLHFMNEIRVPPPKMFRTAAEVALNAQIRRMLSSEDMDVETFSKLVSDSKSLSISLDSELISLEASEKVSRELNRLINSPADVKMIENIDRLIRILRELPLKLNLWHSQNTAFKMAENVYKPMKMKGDEDSKAWLSAFERLCESIGIRLA